MSFVTFHGGGSGAGMSVSGLNNLWLNYQFNQIQNNLYNSNNSDSLLSLVEATSTYQLMNQLNNISNSYHSNISSVPPSTILNLNHANSLLLTADSSLNVQISLAEQMKSWADLASNPNVATGHRADLNNAFQELLTQFQALTSGTNYKGTKLLDGSFGARDIPLGPGLNPSEVLSLPGFSNSNANLQGLDLQTFEDSTSYETGATPKSLVTGDLQGSGTHDFVTADTKDGTLSVYLDNGDGSFQNRVTYEVGTNVSSVTIGDVNGDGVNDLVASNSTDNSISVLVGNGDGTFQAQTTFATYADPQDVKLADLNGDEHLDMVVTSAGDNETVAYLNDGSGNFSFSAKVADGIGANQSITSDINGDKFLDLITADSADGGLTIALGKGDGTFKDPTHVKVGAGVSQLLSGDINGDGNADLVTLNSTSANLSILLGNGDGTFTSGQTITPASSPSSIQLSDLTGDGKLDILVASEKGNTIGQYQGNGNGSFQTPHYIATPNSPTQAQLLDLNGDGLKDLVTLSQTHQTLEVSLGEDPSIAGLNILNPANAEKLSAALSKTINALKEEQAGTHSILNNMAMTRTNALMHPTHSYSTPNPLSILDWLTSGRNSSAQNLAMAHQGLNSLIVSKLLLGR